METFSSESPQRRLREVLARAIHEAYVSNQTARGEIKETNSTLVDWEELPEHLREFNRSQALHIVEEQKVDPKDPAVVPWTDLTEEIKESNRRQADHIPKKLRAIGCDFAPVHGREPRMIEITDEEFEKMAKMEHELFVAESRPVFTLLPETRKDYSRKTRADLVEWEQLPERIKDIDRRAVRAIPDVLAQAGYEIYRLR